MQTKTERLEKIKNYLVKLTSQKTKLEQIEYSGELEVGTEVTFLSAEPLETLELEDRILTFEDNKVSAIEMKTAEVEATGEDVVETEVAGSVELETEEDEEIEVEDVVFDYEKKMAEQDERMRLMDEEILRLLAIIEELSEKTVDMSERVEMLSKEPSVPSEKKTVENFNKTEIKSRAQRVFAS